jgi:hypothetical protein
MGVGGLGHEPAASPPRKRPSVHFCKRLSGPQSQSGRMRKILPQLGFGPRTFHLVESSYNGYAILAHAYKV